MTVLGGKISLHEIAHCFCLGPRRAAHRACGSLLASRRKPLALMCGDVRKFASLRCSAPTGRVRSRVVVLALHCLRRADSAKLARACGSGSSGGHHPSPGTAQPAAPLDGQSHSAAPLRASISLSPFALPSRPLHAASDPRVGHQVPPLHVLSCSGCPTRTARSGSAAYARIDQSLFTTVLHVACEVWRFRIPVPQANAVRSSCLDLGMDLRVESLPSR